MRRIALLTCLATLVPAGPAAASFTQELGASFLIGSSPYNVTAADLNKDGRPDLAVPDANGGTVSVFMRNATTGFTQEGGPIVAGDGAGDVAVGDFNSDTRMDLATANYLVDPAGSVSILLRNPGGGYTQEAGSPISVAEANTIVAARINADNQDDLVIGAYRNDGVKVLYRNAAGTGFEPPLLLQGTGHKRGVAAGDFNHDGRTDVAVVAEPGRVEIWLQKTGGGFNATRSSEINTGGVSFGIDTADFDRDGAIDLAVAVQGADKLLILRNQGNGTFAPGFGSPYTVGDSPVRVTTADFDGNGLPDVAVANQAGASATVLLRSGSGFAPDPSSPLTTSLADVTGIDAADFNQDGRVDLALTSLADKRITIALNSTPFPPPPPPPDLDLDDDGVQTPLDCDDHNPLIKPGAVDVPGDGINQDCSADGDADFPLPGTKIKYSVLTFLTGFSKFGKLTVAPVKAGDKITLQCKGRGCTFKKKTFKAKTNKARLSLLKPLKKAQLRKGAVVTMRMTRAATYGTYAKWRIRAPKASKFTSACLRPGQKKPVKCPSS